MSKKAIPLAILAATLPFIIPGCTASGRIKNPSIRIGPVEFDIPEIEWGPAAPLPEGSTFDCLATVNGKPVQLYTAPSGARWYVDSDGHAHPVVTGDVDCNPTGPSEIDDAAVFGGNQIVASDISTHEIEYAFDQSNDTATFSFTIPAIKSSHYHDVSQLPFLVTESVIFFINGDINVTYSGTINNVLGALWWTRVEEIDFVDSNGIDVNVLFNPNMNIVTIDTSAGSEMMVMTPTNPGIWPLAN